MENQPYTPKQYFTSLNVIHISLLMGQVIFACIAFFTQSGVENSENNSSSAALLIAPLFIVSGIMAGHFVELQQLKKLSDNASLRYKLDKGRTILIIKYALIEGAVLYSIVNYLLSSNYFFLIYAAVGMAFMIIVRPSKERLLRQLKITQEERDQLDQINETISE